MRKEVIGNCTLYNGDCLEILKEVDSFDALISDPPYGIEDMVGGYGRKGFTIAGDKTIEVCANMARAVVEHHENIWMMTFFSCRISPTFFKAMPSEYYFGEIIWDKKAPGMGKQIRYQHENVAVFKIGNPADLNDGFSVAKSYRSDEQSVHTHQKPTALMKRLIEMTPGGTVCDPFMGSGSTGVACVKLGRPFIGIELDPAHFETCLRRIEAAAKEPDMFAASTVQEAMI